MYPSMRLSHSHARVWAALSSARFRLARGLIGDPSAASAAAAVAPPPMAVDRATQLTWGGGCCSSHPCDRDRSAGRDGVVHSRGSVWSAADALCEVDVTA